MRITYERTCAVFAALLVAPFLFVIPTLTAPPAGRLDAGFGAGGMVMTDIFGADDEAFDVLAHEDGRICIAGRTGEFFSTFAVLRYLPNGMLDPGFGEGGKSITVVQGTFSFPTALARSPDGKLVVSGYVQTGADSTQMALVRPNADGRPDTSFGKDGKVIGPFDSFSLNASTGLQKVAVQSDGKIVVTGRYFTRHFDVPFVIRFNADGLRDTSFGENGRPLFGAAEDLLIQPDGKILTAGPGCSLVRTNPDGSADTNFGGPFNFTGGVDTFRALGGLGARSPAIALAPDGKIVLACSVNRPRTVSDDDFALVRFNRDGSLDTTFGVNGAVTRDIDTNDRAKAVLVQRDGKIVVAGYSGADQPNSRLPLRSRITLLRFNEGGSADESFVADKITEDYFRIGIANDITLQPDGRILIAGSIRNNNGSDMLLARFESGLESPPPVPIPDFSLAPLSDNVTVARGKKAGIIININRTGFLLDPIEIIPPDTTAIKARVTPSQVTTSGTSVKFVFKIKRSAVAGTYPLVFRGRDGMGREREATVTLIIN